MTFRDFAVQQILKIRGEAVYGDTFVHSYQVPPINMAADELRDLIEWSSKDIELHEPLLICKYSREEL